MVMQWHWWFWLLVVLSKRDAPAATMGQLRPAPAMSLVTVCTDLGRHLNHQTCPLLDLVCPFPTPVSSSWTTTETEDQGLQTGVKQEREK